MTLRALFFFLILFPMGGWSQTGTVTIPDNAVKGDFNGDGKPDYVWLIKPAMNAEEMDCVGECRSILKFSAPGLADITVGQCIGGIPVNLGDLNGDKTDEIGLLPDWFTSCWHNYYVYSYINKGWRYLVAPIITHCVQWDDGLGAIRKDKQAGYVTIRYSKMTDSDISIKSKRVRLVKGGYPIPAPK